MSDLDLLQSYARDNSQPAFATLVERHLGLVYSAALRQVRSRPLAEEIAQSVFSDLARRAGTLRAGQPLAAWLFVVTRRTAVDVIRHESSRQAREQIAAEIDATNHPAPAWEQVKDLLDEAMTSLSDPERSAILLRFFENRSLREVGDSLGISEDTAQKRVSRALDRLRAFFSRRGVVLTATGLTADLSAHAIETAPAALGPGITAAVASSGAAAGAVGAALAKTTSTAVTAFAPKAIAVAATATATVLGLVGFQGVALLRQRAEIAAQPAEINALHASLRRLEADRQTAALRLRDTQADLAKPAQAQPLTDPEIEAAIDAWLQRLGRLKQLASERADLAIPEFAALSENAWFNAARAAQLATEGQIRDTFRELHKTARTALALAFDRALTAYAEAHGGQLPAEPAELGAFMKVRLPAETFARYEILQRGALQAVPRDELILAERAAFADAHGSRLAVSTHDRGIEDYDTISERQFRQAVRAFAAGQNGRLPAAPPELVAYLKSVPTPAALQALLSRPAADFAPAALRKILTPD